MIDRVLNVMFLMILPTMFKKIQGTSTMPRYNKNSIGNKKKREGKDDKGRKKQKSNNGNGNMVKNTSPQDKFNLVAGELWKENFAMILPPVCPAWTEKIKMCTRWHIKGNCYNNCSRAISHVTKKN
jgi:hypothetical protein